MLTPDLELAREFVASNPPPGRLLMCAVSGAHVYGFPSPDSDLDLKGLHLVPTRGLLGLRPDVAVHDLTAVHRGVECDLTTNEAGAALALLLAGNGNMLRPSSSRAATPTSARTARGASSTAATRIGHTSAIATSVVSWSWTTAKRQTCAPA